MNSTTWDAQVASGATNDHGAGTYWNYLELLRFLAKNLGSAYRTFGSLMTVRRIRLNCLLELKQALCRDYRLQMPSGVRLIFCGLFRGHVSSALALSLARDEPRVDETLQGLPRAADAHAHALGHVHV